MPPTIRPHPFVPEKASLILSEAPGAPSVSATTSAIAEETDMAWKAPKIVEIALGGEINCYACASVK